jgi:hypothetical protein
MYSGKHHNISRRWMIKNTVKPFVILIAIDR